ncbi:MAG: hypothetical protein AB4368_05115 [Xenococcaceae cyanobacterium]
MQRLGSVDATFLRRSSINLKSSSFGFRQPLFKSPNREFTLGLNLDIRRRRTNWQCS